VFLQFEDRKSTSPFVERIWRCKSGTGGTFLSMAEGSIELVVTRLPGFLAVTLRGPVSKGTQVECPLMGNGSPSASGWGRICRGFPPPH
jgi:hypothetical protein